MAIPREKTEVEQYLVYGIDEKYRRIFFGHPLDHDIMEETDPNEFTEISVDLIVRAIKRMEKDHPRKPIEIHMNSCGGHCEPMQYLMDIMLTSTCKFKFYGGGRIQSSATWIMAISDERNLHKNTQIMVHNGSNGTREATTDQNIDVAQNNKVQDKLEQIYADNSFMPKEFWSEVCKRDLYMTAEEAVQLGLADTIIPHRKRASFRAKRIKHLAEKPTSKELKPLLEKLYKRIDINIKPRDFNINISKEEFDSTLTVDDTPVIGPEEDEKSSIQKTEKE